jgi:hypothetical protein
MSAAQPPPRRPAPPAPGEAPTAAAVPPRTPRAPAYGEPPASAPVYGEPVPPAYGATPPYGGPLPPDDPRWWERGFWGEALAALAGLIVGVVIGLVAAEPSSTRTASGERTVTVTGPTHTRTVTRVVVHTHVHTVTTAAPSAAGSGSSSGSETSSGGGAGGRTYTGSGNSRVGTITVSRESTIHWRSGGGFSIKNSPEDERSLAFNSGASSGESPVEPGTYHQVTVNAPGQWTMTISPG